MPLSFEASLVGVGDAVFQDLQTAFADRAPESALRIEWVGPKAGEQLRDAAIQSLLYAIAFIMVYIAFRFEWVYGVAAVLAVFHDVLVTIGFFSLFDREIADLEPERSGGNLATELGLYRLYLGRAVARLTTAVAQLPAISSSIRSASVKPRTPNLAAL